MAIVIDLTGVDADDIGVATSPVAEMLALLHMLAEPDHHPHSAREIARVRESIRPWLDRRLTAFSPLWARFRFRAMLPLGVGVGERTLADELHDIQAMPTALFSAMACEAIIGRRSPGMPDPLSGDAARRAFLADCRARSDEREALAAQFLRAPDAFRDDLCNLLTAFDAEVFGTTYAALLPRVRSAVAHVREHFDAETLAEAFMHSIPGTFADGDRLSVAKVQSASVPGRGRTFLLLPSVYTRPHIVVKYDETYPGATGPLPVVVQFPAIERPGATAPLDEVLARLAVLADPSRIDICRHLVNEPCTTVELSHRTGMSSPQVSRHLRRLKDCGLLISERDGRFVKHRLLVRRVYALGDELLNRLVT